MGLSLTQRIREERLYRVALISAVAASIRVEVAAHFKRIELRIGDVELFQAVLGSIIKWQEGQRILASRFSGP
jgi:hypothetical protein